jgi:hypothetical protein
MRNLVILALPAMLNCIGPLFVAGCGKESNTATTDAGGVCVPGGTQACLGPGQCAGAQSCNSSGSMWGACDCGTGGAAAGGSATGGSKATGGAASGGSSATGGAATGGVSTGGATSCSPTAVPGVEYTHPIYGHGFVWGDTTGPDYWVKFDSGLQYDAKTGYGWYWPSGSVTQTGAIANCDAAVIANISSWKLTTITQLRTLAGGCTSTETGGSCTLNDSCLTYDCGVSNSCGSCRGGTEGYGPHNCEYCRANAWICGSSHTSSNCPDCASYGYDTEWTYRSTNGNVGLMAPSDLIPGYCVVTSVPNF